jgi:hypothetical protein
MPIPSVLGVGQGQHMWPCITTRSQAIRGVHADEAAEMVMGMGEARLVRGLVSAHLREPGKS